jgi:hypothetical protein
MPAMASLKSSSRRNRERGGKSSSREREEGKWRLTKAFFPLGDDQSACARFADAMASRANEHGATKFLLVGTSASTRGYTKGAMLPFLNAILDDF